MQPVDFDCLHTRGGGRRARQSCFTARRLSVSRVAERRHVREKVKMFSSDRLEKGLRLHSSTGPPSGMDSYFKSLLITACISRHRWGYCSLTTLWLGKVLYEAYWAQSKAIVAFITASK